jgi:hypothetical protein
MHTLSLPALDPLQRYSVPEACLYLRISRAKFYEGVKSGKYLLTKDGNRSFLSGSQIAAQSAPA